MGIKRKIALYIITALFALCLIGALCTVKISAFAYTDRIEITSNTGDTFKAEDISFEGNKSFAFCADVNFNNGDAAALTFGETEDGLWAFNVDRAGNRVKLLYFTKTEEGYSAKELKTEHFIGNSKMTQAERLMVEPKVRQVASVHLKVVITVEGENAFLECYADGIRRFAYTDGNAPAEKINLVTDFEGLSYAGGNIGYNVCNADVYFTDVQAGEDNSYYTELYRNKFHFSQFAHWNNDPNGLVYYGGYYHLFYQHYPYDGVWGDMYWGHARSKDLLHWENLPVCLYPERGGADGAFGDGDGYMWSGSARVYHKGESGVIENEGWFGDLSGYADGEGAGLIIFYTRDGGKQDQMIASSDDGGLTWTKRKYIPSQEILGLGNIKTDCRDPKVFEYADGGNRLYGMLLTGMKDPFNVWFLKSEDLVNWESAGGFNAKVPLVNTDATNGPECPDIAFLTADNGEEKTVITLAGRGYIVGDLTFEDGEFKFKVDGEDISGMSLENVPVKQMDFGPDSYATQTFFIEEGEYAGKTVSMSWFSGVPGASASVDSGLLTQLRDGWNCGMTVPVIWGLTFDGENYLLTQTPVTKNNSINKTIIASASGLEVEAGENILKNLSATAMEIDAVISNPDGGNVAFRVRIGENEYTEIGWNAVDGYYVDRTNTASGNISLPNYSARYTSGMGSKEELSFLILCDEGGLEVFCGGGAAAFYAVTFPSPNSSAMSLICETAVTVRELKISSFSSVWSDKEPESLLRIGTDEIEMDLTLCKSRDILVNSTEKVTYEIISGKGVVTYMETENGLKVFAESAGEAVIKASSGGSVQYISVSVYGGTADSDCEYNTVTAGDWYVSDGGYIGYIKAGNAYVFSEREGADFLYSAQFDLKSGRAAALVFRAKADMSDYVMANYDDGEGLVKLWSSAGDSVQVERRLSDLSNIVLTVSAQGRSVKVYLNRELVIETELCGHAPASGLFGLNVFVANVLFKAVSVTDAAEEAYTSGDFVWNHTDGAAFTVVNRSWNNRIVDSGFYKVEGRKVILSQNYMASLPEAKTYVLEVTGQKSLYRIEIRVQSVPPAIWQDVVLQENSNVVFYIGNTSSETLYINGQEADKDLYKIEGMNLTVYAKAFAAGENEIKLNDDLQAKVTVNSVPQLQVHFNEGNAKAIYISLFVIVGAVILGEVGFIAYTMLKKEKKEDGGND